MAEGMIDVYERVAQASPEPAGAAGHSPHKNVSVASR
jgi:hypothetical protein